MLNYIDDQTIEKIKTEAKERIDRIFDEREKIAPPAPETMFQDVYENSNWIIDEERGEIL